ncbi:ABC transporter permease [Aquimonas voraii]|uniref:ABC-2 family transporter protein n=1 Tax=Aquimonas voraii TaxID=265719 RepID=A0A1G6WUB7_9GAMM|nr:ABC transporter permease [Aquimonas voraii]SDD69482.1 ABC-2 family transporter protein [Aquimonas voraii]
MSKVLQIAWREFAATALTKGFLIGLVAVPMMMAVTLLLVPLLINFKSPPVRGEVAVLDLSGAGIDARLAEALSPEALVQRRAALQSRMDAAMPQALRGLQAQSAASAGVEAAFGEVPKLRVLSLPAEADIEREKARLLEADAEDARRLALLVIDADAVHSQSSNGLGSYSFYIRKKLDERVVDEIREALRPALIDARMQANGFDAERVRALNALPRVRPITVGEEGENSAALVVGQILPMAFMMLMFLAIMTAGQMLVTTTVEEKSSRVVEVLLAAVSPTELMAGKILGQLGVGLLMISVYAGLGVLALLSFALTGLIEFWQIAVFALFFLIAFATFGALMAAAGAAVNELREAQSLLTPIVLFAVAPMLLWMPIRSDPNSMLATVLSLTPPVSPFVMVMRISSNTPPPVWQIGLALLIGLVSTAIAMWIAGKVFRVGLLMHGKPPNFATLVRWVRMA